MKKKVQWINVYKELGYKIVWRCKISIPQTYILVFFSRNLASCVANSLGVKFLSSGHMTLQKFADDVY